MKTPSFWYKRRGLAAYALMPLTLLWRMGGVIRRAMATPYHAKVPVICVGNIVAGGAGKTPVALAFARMLQEKGHKPVFVTRGYGGRERGPLRVDPNRHTARDVGDESLLLASVAPVWIGHDRPAAIREAEQHGTHIILDDGLQNPSVLPDLAFLVVDSVAAFGNGCMIPAGPMRETFDEAMKRVTAVILIGEDEGRQIMPRVRCPVLCAKWQPDLAADFPRAEKFLAFAGIARPEKFYETCRKAGLTLAATKNFSDHHMFTNAEFAALVKQAETSGARLLTTEKDFVRLPQNLRSIVTVFPASLVFDEPEAVRKMIDRN